MHILGQKKIKTACLRGMESGTTEFERTYIPGRAHTQNGKRQMVDLDHHVANQSHFFPWSLLTCIPRQLHVS